jgi:hypothetical protein
MKGLKNWFGKGAWALVAVAIALAAGVTLTACGAGKNKTLSDPAGFACDGTKITWAAVENADYYLIQINGGAEQRSSACAYGYSANGGAFTFSIRAVSNNSKKHKDSGTVTIEFKPMQTITAVGVSQSGEISWEPIANASAYYVELDSNTIVSVSAPSYQMPAGQHTARVRGYNGTDASWYSAWSQQKVVKLLAIPQNLTYDGEHIRWNSVSNATGYSIKINDVPTSVGNVTNYAYAAADGAALEISIAAVGNSDWLSSPYGATNSYTYLPAITSVRFDGGELTWDSIPGVSKYKLRFTNNGTVRPIIEVTTNKYYGNELQAGKSLQIEVLAIPTQNNQFSNWSSKLSVTMLSAPVLSVTKNGGNLVFSWAAGQNEGNNLISGYDFMVRNANTNTPVRTDPNVSPNNPSISIPEADPIFGTAATYSVTVVAKAITDGAFAFGDSAASNAITVVKLATPTALKSTHNKEKQEAPTISWNAVAGSDGYVLSADGGEPVTTNSTSCAYPITGSTISSTIVRLRITAKGTEGVVNGNTVRLSSTASDELVITKLGTPGTPVLSEFKCSWAASADANSGYQMSVGGNTLTTNQNSNVELSFPLVGGTYKLTVVALGNGSNVISSAPSQEMEFQKLFQPTGLTISASRWLSWSINSNNNTVSYEIVGLNDRSVTGDNKYQMTRTEIPVGGISVRVRAHGDGTRSINSDMSNDITVYQLAKPTGFTTSDTGVSWTRPDNATFFEVTRTHDGSEDRECSGVANNITAAMLYVGANNFKVVASRANISDGIKSFYVDSEESDVYTVTKLVAPTVSVDAASGEYRWTYVDGHGYEVIFNGSSKTWNDKNKLSVSLSEFTGVSVANYDVKIRALGQGTANTVSSNYVSFTQNVVRLTTPTLTLTYVSETKNLVATVSGSGTTYAKKYKFDLNGTYEEQTSNVWTKLLDTPGKKSVTATLIGGVFANDSADVKTSVPVYYIDSNPCSPQSVTLLPAVEESTISLLNSGNTGNKKISWTAADGVTQYKVSVTVNGADFAYKQMNGAVVTGNTISATEILLENVAQGSTVVITIQSFSTNSSNYPSEVVTKTLTA